MKKTIQVVRLTDRVHVIEDGTPRQTFPFYVKTPQEAIEEALDYPSRLCLDRLNEGYTVTMKPVKHIKK